MPKTITGFIQNKTGRPLETVTVVIKGTIPGTATVTRQPLQRTIPKPGAEWVKRIGAGLWPQSAVEGVH